MSFTVKTDSLIRFVVPVHHVDIDLHLYSTNSTAVDSSTNIHLIDTILYIAKANTKYNLTLGYYHSDYNDNDHVCMSYVMQGAVIPLASIPTCTNDSLPAADALQHPDANGEVQLIGSYNFMQKTGMPIVILHHVRFEQNN